jgi:protein phosphatase
VETPRRHGRRLAVLASLVVLLLVAGAGGGWAYVRSQYYVGADGRQVAVFRGVSGHVAGVDLSSVEERTDLRTDQLGELDAARVEKGIVAKSKADAQQILERLKTLACPTPSPTPVAIPSPKAANAPRPTAAPTPQVTLLPGPLPTTAGCP